MPFLKSFWRSYLALRPVFFSFVTAVFTVSSQIILFMVLLAVVTLLNSPESMEELQNSDVVVETEKQFDPAKDFFIKVLAAPIVETLIFQYALIMLLRTFIDSRIWIIVISTLVFSQGHLENSELSAIQALILGFFFSNAFLHWRDKTGKGWMAALVTCLCHMLHNLAYFGMSFVPASLIF